jgi:ribosomal protein S18 acetylase RimI-like enzyme
VGDDLHLRQGYQGDHDATAAFKAFLIEIHGLDLTSWEEKGYWNDDYRSFSFFDRKGQVVSSVNVYSLDLLVEGELRRGAQISGVGTLPEYRRQGLNRRLTEIALEWIAPRHDFVFLFSDEDAIPFYRATGFQPLIESRPFVGVSGCEDMAEWRRLDLAVPADRALIERLSRERTPVSDVLGVNSHELFMFHALYTMTDCLHYLPDDDLLVLFRRDGERLFLHDVVGLAVPPFSELYPRIGSPETAEVIFSFVPDKLAPADLRWRPYPDNGLFDRGDLPVRGREFLFPITSQA